MKSKGIFPVTLHSQIAFKRFVYMVGLVCLSTGILLYLGNSVWSQDGTTTPERGTALAEHIMQTRMAAAPTRTAVAIMRQPGLAAPTLHPFEATVTSIVAKQSPIPEDVDTWALTATDIVYQLTQTWVVDSLNTAVVNQPELAKTATALVMRTPIACFDYETFAERESVLTPGIAREIEQALTTVSIIDATVLIPREGYRVSGHPACEYSVGLQTTLYIGLRVDDINDTSVSSARVESILRLLSETFPVSADWGLKVRLNISLVNAVYTYGDVYSIEIETDYQNALNAYDEGLRGAELIEALGGWLPQN